MNRRASSFFFSKLRTSSLPSPCRHRHRLILCHSCLRSSPVPSTSLIMVRHDSAHSSRSISTSGADDGAAATSASAAAASASAAEVLKAYEEAVRTLNSLQSNKATLEKIRKERDKNKYLVIPSTRRYLERVGVTEADLQELSVIHVSGTKGKGSTCAFTESILRHHGFKTGFFSSPHLIEVRERIRIGGEPISRRKFTTHFWNVSENCWRFLSLLLASFIRFLDRG